MKSRRDMPLYALEAGTELTKGQLWLIMPRRRKHPVFNSGSQAIALAQTKDGQWWAEWRGSAVFWANRWYAIPKVVGKRAREIDNFIKAM